MLAVFVIRGISDEDDDDDNDDEDDGGVDDDDDDDDYDGDGKVNIMVWMIMKNG